MSPKSLAAIILIAAVAAASSPAPDAQSTAPAQPPTLARATAALDPAAGRQMAQIDPVNYAWSLFTAVNWPAVLGQRGVADRTKAFGADAPVVWGTWKSATPVVPRTAPPGSTGASEVYLRAGSTPGPWASGDVTALPAIDGVQIDGRTLTDPNQNDVVLEVRMNQATYEYITSRQLYSVAGQTALLNNSLAPVQFPAAALEVKASWRILQPGDNVNRYLVKRLVSTSNGTTTTVTGGLTGLHIVSRVLDNWFWATFEQVDNATTTGMNLKLPIDPAVQRSSAQMQQAFAGTRWQFYQLNGVQTDFTAGGAPTRLANSQIESHFQLTSSCITCHSLASAGPPSNLRIGFWIGADAQGYVGASPFARLSKGNVPLDFVWSLRRAQ